ncbi:hypothetical protein AB0I72_01620 [Nocardiopsis sp. NPDC049922]|uniref:hypothetical protein n=1 Tax=Nocardiopsis sp. NPDC049922 TaxID=3155157 RepID=UPI0033E4065E
MPRMLMLARGHGFGHAARDLRVIEAIRAERPDVDIEVLASGSAARYLEMYGEPFTDLGIGDHEDMSPAAGKRIWEVMGRLDPPDLVVADEVVWALPFCVREWRRRAILMTDWFFSEFGQPRSDAFLDYAGEILLLDFSVAHPGPFGTSTPIRRFGQVVADFDTDRGASRTSLGLDPDTPAAVLTVGGLGNRLDNQLISDAVLTTWLEHAPPGHRLYVLGEPFREVPDDRADDVVWAGFTPAPERYYTAADLVIANAYGTVTCDLVWNGVPVLGMTSPEVEFAASFTTRVEAMADAGLIAHARPSASSEELWELMRAGIERGRNPEVRGVRGGGDDAAMAAFEWTTGARVAEHLLRRLDHMAAKSAPTPARKSQARP